MKLFKRKEQQILNELTWKIAGGVEFDIIKSGLIFSKIFTRGGLFVHTYSEHGSNILSGYNTFQLTITDKDIFAPYRTLNFLVALNEDTISKHQFELGNKALIMFDPDENTSVNSIKNKKDLILCPVPMSTLAKASGGEMTQQSIVALGASIAILDYDFSILENQFYDILKNKGQDIIDINIHAAKSGYDHIKENFDSSVYPYRLKVNQDMKSPLMLISGNEALGLGAIKGGIKFFSTKSSGNLYGHPYSQLATSTSLQQFLSKHKAEYGITVKQTEDEISTVSMAMGASFAGVRSMTSSSGDGASLMFSQIGEIETAEISIVAIDIQSIEPMDCYTTWTGQEDLDLALHSPGGEFSKIIVAPGDIEESYYTAIQALNIAENYQLPVIILMDNYLAQNSNSTKEFSQEAIRIERKGTVSQKDLDNNDIYKRYNLTSESGVSPKSIPGMKHGIFTANSNEHDEFGISSEESQTRIDMQEKRFKKFLSVSTELPEPVLYGSENANITIIGWGSTKGVILEAIEMLKKEKISVNFLQILYIWPFPTKSVSEVLANSKIPVIIENNMTAQLGNLITEQTGYDIPNRILKFDGRPFFPEELFQKLKTLNSQKGLGKWLQ